MEGTSARPITAVTVCGDHLERMRQIRTDPVSGNHLWTCPRGCRWISAPAGSPWWRWPGTGPNLDVLRQHRSEGMRDAYPTL